MADFWKYFQAAIVAVGGAIGYFVGGFDGLIIVLIAIIIIDYITGVMRAITDKKLSSEIGFKGICTKILTIIMVGIAHMLDMYVIKTGDMLRTAAIFFYISNEGISVLENASCLGLPIPGKIKAVLEQLHDKAEEDTSGHKKIRKE